jgi:hypothetical protein
MKKVFIIILCSVLFPVLSFGFDISAGFKGGPALNHFYGSDWDSMVSSVEDDDETMKLGFSTGIFLSIDIFKFLSIQPEFYFSLMGGALDYTDAQGLGELKYSYKVLEIPVLVKGNFTTDRLRASIFAGPDFIIPVGKLKMKQEIEGSTVYDWYEFPEMTMRDFIMGLAAGASLDTKTGDNTYITIDVRYVFTFTDLINDTYSLYFPPGTEWVLEPELKGNSLKFMIGFGIRM